MKTIVLGNHAWDREIAKRRKERFLRIIAKYFDSKVDFSKEPPSIGETSIAFDRAIEAEEYEDAEILIASL